MPFVGYLFQHRRGESVFIIISFLFNPHYKILYSMKVGKINGHTVEIYDSIDELPIRRFQKYNKYMLVDSGVGSDLQDILDHIGRAIIYIKANPNMAVAELENLRQAFYLVTEEMSPKYMAFAVLVNKIDGEPADDLSDVGLKRVLDTLNDVKKTWIDRVLDSVKKKMDTELSLYFPGKFEEATTKEYFDQLKNHTLLRLKHIITGEDVTQACREIETRLALLIKPRLFSGKNSAEITYDKQFEETCLVLSQNLQVQPQDMTVLQFYNAFEYLKKEAKKRTRRNKAK